MKENCIDNLKSKTYDNIILKTLVLSIKLEFSYLIRFNFFLVFKLPKEEKAKTQEIVNNKWKELEDKGLLVSCKVSFDEEILKIVRYWIPNVEIISPDYLKEKLETGLKEYLKI